MQSSMGMCETAYMHEWPLSPHQVEQLDVFMSVREALGSMLDRTQMISIPSELSKALR